MKYLLFQSLMIAAFLGFVSCKSSKNATTENMKTKPTELTEKHWKLFELNGIKVSETPREPFIVFEKNENRFHGNTSCNNFFGTFELKMKNKIKFSQGGMTKMACIENQLEASFIQVLESTIVYKTQNDTLIFLGETGSTLARFKFKKTE
jgi:heat shock protein HslJ